MAALSDRRLVIESFSSHSQGLRALRLHREVPLPFTMGFHHLRYLNMILSNSQCFIMTHDSFRFRIHENPFRVDFCLLFLVIGMIRFGICGLVEAELRHVRPVTSGEGYACGIHCGSHCGSHLSLHTLHIPFLFHSFPSLFPFPVPRGEHFAFMNQPKVEFHWKDRSIYVRLCERIDIDRYICKMHIIVLYVFIHTIYPGSCWPTSAPKTSPVDTWNATRLLKRTLWVLWRPLACRTWVTLSDHDL